MSVKLYLAGHAIEPQRNTRNHCPSLIHCSTGPTDISSRSLYFRFSPTCMHDQLLLSDPTPHVHVHESHYSVISGECQRVWFICLKCLVNPAIHRGQSPPRNGYGSSTRLRMPRIRHFSLVSQCQLLLRLSIPSQQQKVADRVPWLPLKIRVSCLQPRLATVPGHHRSSSY